MTDNLERIRAKYNSRQRFHMDYDEEPAGWITMSGTHVPVNEEGKTFGVVADTIRSRGSKSEEFDPYKALMAAAGGPEYTAPDGTVINAQSASPAEEKKEETGGQKETGVKEPKMNTDITTLKNWQSCANDYMESKGVYAYYNPLSVAIKDFTPEEQRAAQANLQKIFDGAEICMLRSGSNLESIIEDGFKNQFETGSSSGMFSNSTRADLSENLFGTPKGTDGSEYEKYGFMADAGNYEQIFGYDGPGYGHGDRVCFIFDKDSVADRTTYTADDSLAAAGDKNREAYAAGAVDTNCSIEGLSYDNDIARGVADGSITDIGGIFDTGSSYMECQFHGSLSIDDVSELRFGGIRPALTVMHNLSENAIERLRESGVRIGYYANDDDLRTVDFAGLQDLFDQYGEYLW